MKSWINLANLPVRKFSCGHCGQLVASDRGYYVDPLQAGAIYVCPNCGDPTYFSRTPNTKDSKQVPGPIAGNTVNYLPSQIESLYLEARNCVSISSHTSSVLTCRKLLMHIGVAQGAPEGRPFIEYIDYLAAKGFVPPNGKGWVDHIRKKGNEANHEIKLMSQADAEELITFVEMLLKFIYEFPQRVPAAAPPP